MESKPAKDFEFDDGKVIALSWLKSLKLSILHHYILNSKVQCNITI